MVNVRNPVNRTPMAEETACEGAIEILLEADEVDTIVVGMPVFRSGS